MNDKYKPGDKLVNAQGTIFLVQPIHPRLRDEWVSGIIIHHRNPTMLGMEFEYQLTDFTEFQLMVGYTHVEAQKRFVVGDWVVDSCNPDLVMMVTYVGAKLLTCIELRSGKSHEYTADDLVHSPGVVISNERYGDE
ncbi:hypothetical protein [Janthinobacterium sp.]|uniref:hypothetical protein n=1 Tax=Janthinobacterium sp. TaxID=1871054 RepID=UPI0026274904|nr:hypothetical protein [Janthinobacterium sp.]